MKQEVRYTRNGRTATRKAPGPRNRKEFTEENVLHLPCKRKQYMCWDKGVKGLHVLVSPQGARTYRSLWYYRGSSKPHSRSLGRVGIITLEEARDQCRADQRTAWEGRDPKTNNPALSDSFKACVERYISEEQIGNKENVTAREAERLMLKACAAWHSRPIATIRPQEIQSLLIGVRDGDADKDIRPKRHLANKLFGNLKTFFAWCAKPTIGLLSSSPMIGMERPWGKAKPRERVYDNDELKKLWECPLEPKETAFLQLLILTGKRKGALAAMKWGEIDHDGFWKPPSGRDNKRVHATPLPTLAQDILRTLKPEDAEPDDYVFPSGNGGNSGALRVNARFQHRVQKLTGIEDFMPHAIRHTVETKLAELEVPTHLRDLLLDHVPSRGAGKNYDHWEYKRERREALEKWGAYIQRILNPGQNVIEISEARA